MGESHVTGLGPLNAQDERMEDRQVRGSHPGEVHPPPEDLLGH